MEVRLIYIKGEVNLKETSSAESRGIGPQGAFYNRSHAQYRAPAVITTTEEVSVGTFFGLTNRTSTDIYGSYR